MKKVTINELKERILYCFDIPAGKDIHNKTAQELIDYYARRTDAANPDAFIKYIESILKASMLAGAEIVFKVLSDRSVLYMKGNKYDC